MQLRSTAFQPNGPIPALFSCQGDNVSPPLVWTRLPPGTRSLVLIVDDPDAPDPEAPRVIWVHWVLYNLPPDVPGLEQAATTLPHGTLQGRNDWGRLGYAGPCPEIGRHRYFHKLYALDLVLPDMGGPIKGQLERVMRGHILEETQLVGTYEKAR